MSGGNRTKERVNETAVCGFAKGLHVHCMHVPSIYIIVEEHGHKISVICTTLSSAHSDVRIKFGNRRIEPIRLYKLND